MTQPRKQRKPRKPKQKPVTDNTTALLEKIKQLQDKITEIQKTPQRQPRPIGVRLPPAPRDTARLGAIETEIKELQKRLPITVQQTDPRATIDFNTLRQFAERQTQSSTVDYLSKLQATQQEKEQKAIDKLLEDTYKTDIETRDKKKVQINQAKAKGDQEEFFDLISMVSKENKERTKAGRERPTESPFISRSPSIDSIDEIGSSASSIYGLLESRAIKTRTERPKNIMGDDSI
jgi:hypothetical protein